MTSFGKGIPPKAKMALNVRIKCPIVGQLIDLTQISCGAREMGAKFQKKTKQKKLCCSDGRVGVESGEGQVVEWENFFFTS